MAENDAHEVDGGRDDKGRFTPGNSGGPGNPYARRVAALRAALMDAVTDDDIREVVKALLVEAKAGNVPAAREILDRLLGRALTTLQGEVRLESSGPLLGVVLDASLIDAARPDPKPEESGNV